MFMSTRCACGGSHVRTTDRVRKDPGLVRVRRLEERYARDLRKIARHVGEIINAWAPRNGEFDLSKVPGLRAALARYAEAITPWAETTAGRIIEEIAIREKRSWAEHAKAMSLSLRQELNSAPTGLATRRILAEHVRLITSLPTEAAERVHRLTLQGLETSNRASTIAREIMRSGEVTQSRANLIARTEVSRTASTLLQARAEHIGSVGYIWRTAEDSDVRPSHQAMQGEFVRWDKPPTLDGMTGHAGGLPNCRCYPEPVIPAMVWKRAA